MNCREEAADGEDQAWLAWLGPVREAAAKTRGQAGSKTQQKLASASVLYRHKRDGGDLSAVCDVLARRSRPPAVLAVRYAKDPYLMPAPDSTTTTSSSSSSFADSHAQQMELNTQPSGICGIVTDFVWPPMDTHQTALPVDAFGDVEKCCFFAEIGGGVQVFPGQEDPSLENSYFDEDDPVTHAPKAVRRQAEGLVVGGSAAGAAFSLGADLSLGAAGRSGYFAGRDRGKVQPVDGTSLAGAFRVLDVAVVQLLTTSTQRSESDAGAGVTGHSPFDEANDYGAGAADQVGLTAEQENQDTFMLNFISSATRNQAVNRNYFG